MSRQRAAVDFLSSLSLISAQKKQDSINIDKSHPPKITSLFLGSQSAIVTGLFNAIVINIYTIAPFRLVVVPSSPQKFSVKSSSNPFHTVYCTVHMYSLSQYSPCHPVMIQ